MERQPRRLPVYLKANTVRMCLIWGTIPIIAIYAVDAPVRMLGIFLVMYGISHLVGGVAGLPFSDLVGKLIPKPFWGTFYAIRLLVGYGILSVAAGLAIGHILADEDGFPFPTNFVVIFGTGATLMMLGYLTFSLLRELPGAVSDTPRSWQTVLREVPTILGATTTTAGCSWCSCWLRGVDWRSRSALSWPGSGSGSTRARPYCSSRLRRWA